MLELEILLAGLFSTATQQMSSSSVVSCQAADGWLATVCCCPLSAVLLSVSMVTLSYVPGLRTHSVIVAWPWYTKLRTREPHLQESLLLQETVFIVMICTACVRVVCKLLMSLSFCLSLSLPLCRFTVTWRQQGEDGPSFRGEKTEPWTSRGRGRSTRWWGGQGGISSQHSSDVGEYIAPGINMGNQDPGTVQVTLFTFTPKNTWQDPGNYNKIPQCLH